MGKTGPKESTKSHLHMMVILKDIGKICKECSLLVMHVHASSPLD